MNDIRKWINLFELKEWIDLFELKEYFDISKYGAWVSDKGQIEYVEDHGDWVWDKYHSEDYHVAYDDGWVRIIFDPTSTLQGLHINGYSNTIKNIFKYWWPAALKSDRVWIDTDDNDKWYEYKMPNDRIKLQKKWLKVKI